MEVVIASDHGAFNLKTEIISYLKSLNIPIVDVGCYSLESSDYPLYAFKAARMIKDGVFGIVCCTSGVGVSICANKVKGVRCALCFNPEMAKMARLHNDANCLALGANTSLTPLEIVKTFLETKFSFEERHKKRVQMILDLEEV